MRTNYAESFEPTVPSYQRPRTQASASPVPGSGLRRAAKAAPLEAVYIVEDDESLRSALRFLVESVGLHVSEFASAQEFMLAKLEDVPACMVLDVRLPGISGLDFQARLNSSGTPLPLVFVTGHGDITMSVQAMKAGAIDFLPKPFRDQDLLDAIASGLQRDRQRRRDARAVDELARRYRSLSPRERQVMGFVISGLMNKQIAAEIGLSEITVKIHRAQVMRKMGQRSLADLVWAAAALEGRGKDDHDIRHIDA